MHWNEIEVTTSKSRHCGTTLQERYRATGERSLSLFGFTFDAVATRNAPERREFQQSRRWVSIALVSLLNLSWYSLDGTICQEG